MLELSLHASRRCRQRGITSERLQAIISNADLDLPVGSNCRLLKVSRDAARKIVGWDGLEKQGVLVSDVTGEIVTVLLIASKRQGRRYRKGGA